MPRSLIKPDGLPPVLRKRLSRLAPADIWDALCSAGDLETIWQALVEEEQRSHAPTWAQRQLIEIVRTTSEFESICVEHIANETRERKNSAEVLRAAAEILDKKYPGVSELVRRKRNLARGWPSNLRLMARLVERPEERTITPQHLGRRGGARDPDGGRRGAAVRKLGALVPERLSKRYAIIARLLTAAGQETSPQLVRSILERGAT
jgi:hypothetical protein